MSAQLGLVRMLGSRRGLYFASALTCLVTTLYAAQIGAGTHHSKRITGMVSCMTCGLSHTFRVRKGPNQDADCTRTCVSARGSGYALVAGKQIYLLTGDVSEISKHAGSRATVTGSVVERGRGLEFQVESIR